MNILDFKIPVFKKKWGLRILLTCCLITFVNIAGAQVNQYTFSQSINVYSPISGTVLATATATSGATPSLDSHISNIPDGSFPFPFNFNGTNYTGCNMSSNGFITFGSTAPTTTLTTPISSTTAYNGAISAWAGDLNAVFNTSPSIAGSMRWDVLGVAPNRIIAFQWTDFRPAFSSSTTNVYRMNFQIRLHEGSNIVSIIYGNPQGYVVGSTAISGSRQIGLRGSTNADFNNRTNSTSILFTSSAPGTLNSSTQAFNTINATPGMPTDGLTYTWAPPTCFPPTGLTATNTTTTSTTLNWTGPTLGTPVSYVWEVRNSGAPGSGSVGLVASGTVLFPSTSDVVMGLTAETNYFAYIRSDCGLGDLSAWSPATTFKTAITPCSPVIVAANNFHLENFESGMGNWVSGGTNNSWAFGTAAKTVIMNSQNSGLVGTNVWVTGGLGTGLYPANEQSFVRSCNYDLSALSSGSEVELTIWWNTERNFDGAQLQYSADGGVSWINIGVLGDPFNWYNSNVMSNSTVSAYFGGNTNWWSGRNSTSNGSSMWVVAKHALPNSALTSQTYFRIAFASDPSVQDDGIGFDNFKISDAPACLAPANLTVSNISVTGADFNWSAPGSGSATTDYEWEVRTSGLPGSGAVGLVASGSVIPPATSVSVSGLSGGTAYTFYVRNDCGSAQSSYISITFNTLIANDLCADAIPISCGSSISSTTVGAAPDANACGGASSPGVWYSFTSPTSQLLTLSLCTGTTYDSRLSAYTGTCGTLSMVACNDDFCGLQSQISFVATGGVTYYILVNAFSTSSGAFTLTATCAPPPSPTCPTSHTPSNNAVNVLPNQQLSWSGSQFATSYNVYFGTTNPPSFAGNTASTTFNPGLLSYNTVYYWRVEPINEVATIDNCITNQFTTAPPPPANDLCEDAITVNCGDIVSGQTASATNTGNGPTCITSASTAGGVWYKFIGDGKIVTASLCGSSYDTKIFVYTGTCGNFSCVTGNDDFCGLSSQVTFTSALGTEYYILVAGFSTATGNFTLSLSCECAYSASITQSLTGVCNQVNLTANASLPGTYTYLWSTGETTQTIQVQVASTQNYSVTVFDANNCDESATTVVEFNNGPAINVTPVEQLFCGTANVQLDAGSSGALNYTNNTGIIVPNSGSSTPYPSTITASGLSAGATVANVTISGISHTFPSDLDIALVSPTGTIVLLMADAGGSTDLTGESYTFSDGAVSNLTSGYNATGTYKPTNLGSWSGGTPPSGTFNTTLSSFAGALNGIWSLYVFDDAGGDQGGISGWSIEFADASALTYSWTPTTELSDPSIPNPIATPTTSTLYTVVVTDPSSGCTSSGSANILVDPVPVPVITSTESMPLCEGEFTTLSTQYQASGGFQFSWNGGLFISESITINVPGTYDVVVTSPNGCVSNSVTSIVEVASIFAGIGSITDVLCPGGNDGTVEISALGSVVEPSGIPYFGPFYYSVNEGPQQASPLFTGLSAGTYTFEVHDPTTGCILSILGTVGQPDPLTGTTSVVNNVSCYGGSNGTATAQGSGGVGPYTYNWLTPIPKQVQTNNEIPAGTWTVVITDANGCTATATVTISQPNPVVVDLGPDKVVPWGTANGYSASGTTTLTPSVSGGTTPYTGYLWNTGATTSSLTVTYSKDTVITYMVTVTDANGCTGTDAITVIWSNIDCSNNNNGTKVKICMVPPGNPAGCQTVCISVAAAPALLANTPSYLGSCNPGCAPARVMAPEDTEVISVNLLPNPTTGRILVDFASENQSASSIVVTDLQGRVIMNVALDGSASFTRELDMSGLENGLYILNIMNNEGLISTSRVVKAN